MTSYRLAPDVIEQTKKSIRNHRLYVAFGVVVVVLILTLIFDWSDPFTLLMTFVAGFLMLGVVAIGMRTRSSPKASSKADPLYLEFTLDGDTITRRGGLLDIALRREQVTKLVEMPGLGLSVIAPGQPGPMFISAYVADYDTLRAALSEWAPIEVKRVRGIPSFTLIGIALYVGVMVAWNDWLVLFFGLLLLLYGLAVMVTVLFTPGITMRSRLYALVVPLVLIPALIELGIYLSLWLSGREFTLLR